MTFAIAVLGLGHDATAQAPGLPVIVVTCTDAADKPVIGAQVHVFQFTPQPEGPARLKPAGPFTTGADGMVRTAVALTWDGGRFDRWVYAVVPGKLVGGLRRMSGMDGDPCAIAVQLVPSRSLTGRVKVPEGFAAKGVRVRVLSLSRIEGENLWASVLPRQSGIAALQDVLPERFDCTVGEDGTFVLADLPVTPLLYLAAEGAGLGQAQFSNASLPGRTLPERIELVLERESVLAGTVLGSDGKPAAGATVQARITSGGPQLPVSAAFTTKTSAEGAFRIAGLQAATFEVSIQAKDAVFRPRRLDLGTGQCVADFAATLETPIEVTGTVVSEGDGKLVERVGVSAIADLQTQTGLGHALTDAMGRFTLRLPRGSAMLYFGSVPPGFVYPSPQILTTLDIVAGEKQAPLRFELARKRE